jgi:complement component 1 Q subcomponent-binding protein
VQILARGPPQPFTLTDTAGKPEVILRRSFGKEDIALTCVTQPSDFVGGGGGGDSYNEEHEDQDPDEHRVVNVKVSVTKGADQPVLEFSCLCQPDSIAIEHVCYLESKDLKETFYDGPEFS